MNVSKYCRENGISRRTYYYKPRGETPLKERVRICKENGISSDCYKQRIKAGWSETEAMYTPKYQYRLPDGRLLIHAFDSLYKYQKAWRLINEEGMTIEEAYDYVISGKKVARENRSNKYMVDGIPLTMFCKQNNLKYDTARRYLNNEIEFVRSSKNVDSVVSALRGKKVCIRGW